MATSARRSFLNSLIKSSQSGARCAEVRAVMPLAIPLRSMTMTERPRFINSYAVDSPAMPEPTTATSHCTSPLRAPASGRISVSIQSEVLTMLNSTQRGKTRPVCASSCGRTRRPTIIIFPAGCGVHAQEPARRACVPPALGARSGVMGLFTKDIKTMDDLLLHGLQDIYYAEEQITKALPKMIDKATNRDLATGLKNHLEETNKQIERLEKVFEKLGQSPSGTQCPAIDGIIKEADETAGEIEDKTVLDAALVANAQAVEHYEICRYGTLIAWAEELGHDDIVRFLTTNLNEEKAANAKLNTVALRKGVNKKASTSA
ncbi:ferritin-like metal-binding protein YciE [Bradyrhizobium elkanii]|nr:ferritin-like metal-binding protein YciE [Bradyrhizobium elkanii]MCS3589065.1 ferritin-like metal-binding protein YciE [Bradyrhizobium elkanii]MCS4111577.1 ferritin-like metal-binding protein YciE [Bradyrhizobium elkanii]MCW2170778.1 ferritin-like metal-binding protein YciE [Bradyrhizobium elkanii]